MHIFRRIWSTRQKTLKNCPLRRSFWQFAEKRKQVTLFRKETEDSKNWAAKYILTGCGLSFLGFAFLGFGQSSQFDCIQSQRARKRLMLTYGLFTTGILLSGGVGYLARKHLMNSIIMKRPKPFAAAFLATAGIGAAISQTQNIVLPVHLALWLIVHGSLGLASLPLHAMVGKFFYQCSIFYICSLASLGFGGFSSFCESEDRKPNHLLHSWMVGMVLAGTIIHLIYPYNIYDSYLLFHGFISYVYTRDAARVLQEHKHMPDMTYDPAYEAINIHIQSLRRCVRGVMKAFTY